MNPSFFRVSIRVEKEHTLIFLTGFSGSGKSTIGPLLANSLGYDFVDLDHAIERAAGKSINRIFAEEGESAFRQLEAESLQQLGGLRETVVSLGGGVLENDRSFGLVTAAGTLVYLKSSAANLARRLQHKTDRPLLKGQGEGKLSRDELEARIEAILAKREERYRSATITVQTDQKRIGSTVEELTRKIERYIRRQQAGGGTANKRNMP